MWGRGPAQRKNNFKKNIYWCYGHRSTNILVLLVLAAPKYWCYNVCSTNILVLLVTAAPIGEDTQTFYKLKNLADFLNVCSANILVLTGLQHLAQYKENQNVCSTMPIGLNVAYLVSWSKRKWK
jgi:hypothetical protein